jgi:inorganic pyrophosphatase
MDINVIIEISKGSNIKYEYDDKTKRLICDRILHTPFTYFFNYGYIENTLSKDGDPLDAILLCNESLMATCNIKCRAVGYLNTIDESGEDPKIIVVPLTSIDPLAEKIQDLHDIDNHTLEKLKYFFENYKKLEKNKWTEVKEFGNKFMAELIIIGSMISTD